MPYLSVFRQAGVGILAIVAATQPENIGLAMRGTIAERFESKVERIPFLTCWVWIGTINNSGYGILSLGKRTDGRKTAHRIAYELFRGSIPNGFEPDHLCQDRKSVV